MYQHSKQNTNSTNENSITDYPPPPQEWLEDIEEEKQMIVRDFYFNYFDIWEIIKGFSRLMEEEDAIVKEKTIYRWLEGVEEITNTLGYSCDYGYFDKKWWADEIRSYGYKNIISGWDCDERGEFCISHHNFQAIMEYPYKEDYADSQVGIREYFRDEYGLFVSIEHWRYFMYIKEHTDYKTNMKKYSKQIESLNQGLD